MKGPAAALAVFVAACSVQEARVLPAPPPHLGRWMDAIDPEVVGREAAALLSEYIRVDTTNPPGNEAAGAALLASALEREGIAHELVELAPGRASLIARLPGSGKAPPYCMLSHIDVVAAVASQWSPDVPPFAGLMRDGFVYGRGALDMKGTGVAQLFALVHLKRLGVPLARDVILLAVADEEVGNGGIRQLLEHHWARIGCSQVVAEGGVGLTGLFFPEQTVFTVSVAEKGATWLELRARGIAGHGSTPLPGTAMDTLLEAIRRLREREPEPIVHASFDELLAAAAEEEGGVSGFVLRRPALVRWFVLDDLMEDPVARAAITNTLNITGLDSGGNEPNVVPGEIRATLDCRLLPGVQTETFLAEVRELLRGLDVELRVLHADVAGESPRDDSLYTALVRHSPDGRPRSVAGPAVFVGSSDATPLRAAGVRVYGMMPFMIDMTEARTMHGDDERLSIENLGRAVRVLFRVAVEVAGEGA